MKKTIASVILLIALLLSLSGCSKKELPHGRAVRICVQQGNEAFTLGKGSYEYLDNGMIKYICDDNGKISKTWYFSIYTLSYIAEEK